MKYIKLTLFICLATSFCFASENEDFSELQAPASWVSVAEVENEATPNLPTKIRAGEQDYQKGREYYAQWLEGGRGDIGLALSHLYNAHQQKHRGATLMLMGYFAKKALNFDSAHGRDHYRTIVKNWEAYNPH